MKGIIKMLLFCTVISSCATYVDRYSYASDRYELFVFNDLNLLKDLSNNAFNVDTEVYHGNAFAITLPVYFNLKVYQYFILKVYHSD